MTNNKYPLVSNFSELHQEFYEVLSTSFSSIGKGVGNAKLREIKEYAVLLVKEITLLQEKGFEDAEILKWGNFVIQNIQNKKHAHENSILSFELTNLIATGYSFCTDYREVFGNLVKHDNIKAEKEKLNQAISTSPESTSKNDNATFKI